MNYPENVKYTKDHEWIRVEEDGTAVIGITDFAQSELGEIVYVDIPTLDEEVKAMDVFGSIEAVKTVSDLFMPATGKVIEVNEKLEEHPELVNEDPYGTGWIIKAELSDTSELSALMDATAYHKWTGKD